MTDHPLLNHAKGRQPVAAFGLLSLRSVVSWRRPDVSLLPRAATARGFPLAAAMAAGMNTLWQDGLGKAALGVTTIEELSRVVR